MLEEFLSTNQYYFEKDINLSSKTWLKTGGKVSYWIQPNSINQLVNIIVYLKKNNHEFELVGQTTNIYFRPKNNYFIIISAIKVNKVNILNDLIECECGALVSSISRKAVNLGFQGFYGLVNLPGSIGAAVINNSSCFNCSVSALMLKVEVLCLETLKISELFYNDFKYIHHSSQYKGNKKIVVLRVFLKCDKGIAQIEREKAKKVTIERRLTQEPGAYTLGSVCSQLILRNNIKNFLARGLVKINFLFGNKDLTFKRLLLIFYQYNDLDDFISDKTINTFIWKKDCLDLDVKYLRYKEFLRKVFKVVYFEIEEK